MQDSKMKQEISDKGRNSKQANNPKKLSLQGQEQVNKKDTNRGQSHNAGVSRRVQVESGNKWEGNRKGQVFLQHSSSINNVQARDLCAATTDLCCV